MMKLKMNFFKRKKKKKIKDKIEYLKIFFFSKKIDMKEQIQPPWPKQCKNEFDYLDKIQMQ